MKAFKSSIGLLAFCCFGLFAQGEESLAKQAEVLNQAYQLKLYPKHDPFARIFNIEQGKKTFGRMLQRKAVDGSFHPSPMSVVNAAIFHFDKASEMDTAMVEGILEDAQLWLDASDKHALVELQANRFALEFVKDYLRRYGVFEKNRAAEWDGIPPTEERAEDKSNPQESPPSPPEYPDLPEDYEPGTKALDESSGGDPEEKFVIAKTNFKTGYFGLRYFSELMDHGDKSSMHEVDLRLPPRVLSPKMTKDAKRLTIYPGGKYRGGLFLPPGYEPRQSTDSQVKIEQKSNGGFTFELAEPLDSFEIPIVNASPKLSPLVLDAHTRPSGVDPKSWPSKMRAPLFSQFSPALDHSNNPLDVAKWIKNFVSKKYLYSVGERPEKTAVAALEAGSFQCDMAAMIMASLLRDIYKIPTRIVAGYRGKEKRSDSDAYSYLVLPSDAHAWVEVYADGAWHLFDPTPVTKDQKDEDEQNGEKDPYSDVVDDESEVGEEEEDSEVQPGDSADSQDDKNEEAPAEENAEGDKAQGDKGEAPEQPRNESDAGGDVRQMDERELAAKLEMGSVSLKDERLDNPLLELAYRSTLRFVLEPIADGATTMDRLVAMGGLFRSAPDPLVKNVYLQALSIHAKNHPDLATWLEESRSALRHRDLADTFRDLHRARSVLSLYSDLLGSQTLVKKPHRLLSDLDDFLEEVRELAHPDSDDIGIAKAFYDSLPPLARSLVQEKFGLRSVGANAPTLNVANELKKPGGLASLKLLAGLSGLSDFILEATPRPEYQPVKTWMSDTRGGRRNDLLPLTRFSELSRSISLSPGQSIESSLRQGKLFSPAKRKRVLIPTGFGEEDSERITILLYDTSGSMHGDFAYFQSALISSFVSQALSDVSPSGAYRHKIILVPFDHKVHDATKVTNRAEALEVIRTYKKSLGNTGGGTDIQKAMLQGLALIADAEQRAGEPLAAANIVLMSDGDSDVNLDELREARNAIDRSTPIQSMFVAIGGQNEKLMEFAQESKGLGFERGFYRQFTGSDITKHIKKSKEKTVADEAYLYTDKRSRDLSRRAIQRLDTAISGAYNFRSEILSHSDFVEAQGLLDNFEQALAWNDVEHQDRPLEEWLKEARSFAYNRVFKDKALLSRVLDELVNQFTELTSFSFKELSDAELEHLRHLLAFAAGLEN